MTMHVNHKSTVQSKAARHKALHSIEFHSHQLSDTGKSIEQKADGMVTQGQGARGKGTGFLCKVIEMFWDDILEIVAEY